MLERWTPTKRNWALALLGALIVWFAWTVRSALNPLLLGLLFAYILHPMVLKLEQDDYYYWNLVVLAPDGDR